jgi:uncharacterized membrane protein YbaN (DUF454 family)
MLRRAAQSSAIVRYIFLVIGCLGVALGVIGLFTPVMPSTVFMILALWAFSHGSERFHDWLFNHRVFGPALRAWRAHRVIPPRAKLFAIGGMAVSLVIVLVTAPMGPGPLLPAIYGGICLLVSLFILSRPSAPPAPSVAGIDGGDEALALAPVRAR